jgi:hypothetical protein
MTEKVEDTGVPSALDKMFPKVPTPKPYQAPRPTVSDIKGMGSPEFPSIEGMIDRNSGQSKKFNG